MNVETVVKLNKFQPRPYQLPILDAIENKGYRGVVAILPRRAGKDIVAFNLCIRYALKKVCVVYYIFPTYASGRKIIWDSITNDGRRILDYIPPEVIESKNSQEMKIRFKNGSLIQIVGSDNYNSLMGTNPQLCVFSEYALQDPTAYQFIRPILAANDGTALFISTPRGKNHLHTLYQLAKNSDKWFAYKLTLDDTQHIPIHEVEKERAEGLMSEDLIQQEYYTSFDMGIEGSFYSKYLDRMRIKGQITQVPWENGFKVNTAWDLGIRDTTCIIFFQVIGATVRIIDCYENNGVGLDHYAKILQQKPYQYGKHFAPHDIKVRELGTGITRLEKARQLGIPFIVAPDISIEDGIEAVRSSMAKIWIDEVACKRLLNALESYHQEFNPKLNSYNGRPVHDWSSNYCFTGETLVLTRNGMRQIMDIPKNTEVLTMEGWKKCNGSTLMQKNAELVEVTFQDGTKVRCTPDHMFLTVNGWKSAESLPGGTEIQSSLTDSHNTLMDHFIECTRVTDIYLRAVLDCIDLFGWQLLAISHHHVTFTTKTAKRSITIYGTWNALISQNTYLNPDRTLKVLMARPELRRRSGILRQPEDCGILEMQLEQLRGQSGYVNQGNACIAREHLTALLERMGTCKNSVTPIVKPLFIESVKQLNERADVWCINVPDVAHFSLSNGAVVHNSDTMRYLCVCLSKTRDGSSPEELDRRYNETMYGHQLPGMFQDDGPRY